MRAGPGIVLVALASALLGAMPAAAASPHGPPQAEAIAWRACGDLECASVRVPLDWDRPGGRQIKLAVIRHRASRPGKRIGSLFVNPGGPGGSVDEVLADAEGFDAIGRGRFDVVGWDIRGAGASPHVRCFRDERARSDFFRNWAIPTTRPAQRRYVGRTARLARRCGRLSGPILRHMSTADTARDLDYLRRLVADRRLSYLGISGGTFIGQTYANMFPRRVRAMVLDGVLDPVHYTKGTQANYVHELRYTDRAFAGFLSLCESAGPARCALAGHGPVTPRFEGLLAELRKDPIPAPTASPPGELTYGDALSAIVVNMSGSPGSWPDLAAALEGAAEGDRFAAARREPGADDGVLVGDVGPRSAGGGPHRRRQSRAPDSSCVAVRWSKGSAGSASPTGRYSAGGGGRPAPSWLVRSADRYTGPWNVTTSNPILVIGTRFDPNTPYADARRTARRLGNAVLLTHDGYSHTSRNDPSECLKRATAAYLTRPRTPAAGTVCASDREPFDPQFGEPLRASEPARDPGLTR